MKNEKIFFTDKSEIGMTHAPIKAEPKKFWSGAKVGEYKDITDIAKAVREFVKTKYPKSKFSITTEKYSGGRSLSVTLMSAPFNPIVDDKFWSVSTDNKKYYSVNQFYIETSEALSGEAKKVFSEIREFYNQFNYNNSDPQTDYFSVGFYETLAIGRWDKGFEQTPSKSKVSAPKRTPNPLPEKGGGEAKYNIGDKVNYKTSKGSEDGTVKRVKYVASKTAYLYTVTNPRGGDYNIWESNILFKVFGEKPETPTALFNVGDIVTVKGKKVQFSIVEPIEYEGEMSYKIQQLGEELYTYLPEKTLELVKEKPKFKVGQTVKIKGRPHKYIIKDIPVYSGGDYIYEGKYTETGDLFPLFEDLIELSIDDVPEPNPNPEAPKEENSSLALAIEELKETNDLLWEMYSDTDETNLRKELRLTANDNSFAVNEFSADLFFDPEKFLNNYFEKATQSIAYDNTALSDKEFKQITNSQSFKNWFGDFTKPIPDTLCSKVVTLDTDKYPSTRQPLIVYHGTWNKTHFSRFKFTKFPIIYFASNKSYAEWFAKMGTGIMYECFLDIKFLCDFRDLGLKDVTWNELGEYLFAMYGILLPKSNNTNKMKAWGWIRSDAPEFKLINTIKEFGFTGMVHIENNPQDLLPNGEENTTQAYMIFKPEQAKLVRYVESSNAFTDILFMKKGGSVKSKKSLLDEIKNLKF